MSEQPLEAPADPKPPRGLTTRGKTLWREVVADFDLRSDELRVLECAARLWDEIGAMEAELKDSPKLVPGSRGQLTANPLLSEVRAHRRELRGQLLDSA